MINRYLYKLLEAGIEKIQNNISILDSLFQDNYVLSDEELNTIKTYFKSHSLNVINGYPRSDSEFPLVAITLFSDREVDYVLNNEAEPIDESDSVYFGMDLKTVFWEYVYQLLLYTDHPDITSYYYEMIKAIITYNLDYLSNLDCYGFSLSGSELAPDTRYLPEYLFARQLTFKCNSEFQIFDRDSKQGKAFRVTGIHIDKNESNYDIGNVASKVTTYEE